MPEPINKLRCVVVSCFDRGANPMALAGNRTLANNHRVALGAWPLGIEDPRTCTLEALFNHVNHSGYDGVEIDHRFLRQMNYFPDASDSVLARRARRAAEQAGSRIFGSTIHLFDHELRERDWLDKVVDKIQFSRDLGGEYVSFQLGLHPDYLNTGGVYRQDQVYLAWCADRIHQLRSSAWHHGMNFYVETHIRKISEDPQAFARILEMATCEVNGDLSHYLYRGIIQGEPLHAIYHWMGHSHVRLCRVHGDLSAEVLHPEVDWHVQDELGTHVGLTWQAFRMMMPGLSGGLSSRTLVGESGQAHLVGNGLDQDVLLVPLYRAMARYADAQAQGIVFNVETPGDLDPWGRSRSNGG